MSALPMPRPRPRRLAALALSLALGAVTVGQEPPAATGAPAGQAPSEAVDTVFDSVRVHVVNLEVFVTDRAGNPITGLTADDFELIVDRRAVPITNFFAVSPAEAVLAERAEVAAPADGTAATPEATAPPVSNDVQDLHLVFYIDNFNLRPVDRNLAIRALQRFVSLAVPRGARMMLVTYDHGFHVRQPFTTDPAAIVHAASETAELAGLLIGADADRRQAINDIDEARDEDEAIAAAVSYAEARMVELARPLDALAELMQPLGGLPGRKALVYLSNGIPHRVGEDLFFMAEERFPRSRARMRSFLYETVDAQDRLTNAANAAGVTIYSLDATGLASFDSLSAAEGGSRHGGSYHIVDIVNRSNLQIPLQRMADATGGVSITNSNNLELFFDRLGQDATTYYSLGYHAAPGTEGRYLPVEVRVRRKGAQVRTRSGFRVRSAAQRLEQGVTSALSLGREDDDFPAQVSFGTSTPQENGLHSVPLVVHIPLGGVTLIPGPREWVGRLRLAVQARDDRGEVSPLSSGAPLELRIPAAEVEAARGQHVTWTVDLLMKPGRHELAIGLADLLSDQYDVGLGSVVVPSS